MQKKSVLIFFITKNRKGVNMEYKIGDGNLSYSEAKAQKREEAEIRNKEYQALSLEEKMDRQNPGGKVYKKLMAQKEKM